MDRHDLKLFRLTALILCAMQLPAAQAQDKPRSLYDGAAVLFERAQVIKPRENAASGLAHALAPLIIQEVCEPNATPVTHQPETAAAAAQMFFEAGTVLLGGLKREQMTYWWLHSPRNAERTPKSRTPVFKGGATALTQLKAPSPTRTHDGDAAQPQLQGVRLTMNAERVPVIYEVLENHQNIGKIFVTQSVEAAALAEFGPALPGRRHAVERSLSEAPRVVVPRVIDDPPDFMGPILYLHAETHDVATLICRCMNAQVKALAGQRLYELVPAEASGNTFDATRLEAAHPRWLREDFINQTDRLTRSLRLPTGF